MASAGTFFKYSFLQTFKNTRRTFSAILGVTLAVTLVAAENISVDSSARAVMDRLLSEIPVDMMARTATTTEFPEVARSLAGVSLVDRVEPVSAYHYQTLVRSAGNATAVTPINLSGVGNGFGAVASRFGLSGTFRLSPGGIVISQNLSAAIGAAAGQRLSLVKTVPLGYNYTTMRQDYQNNTVELSIVAVVSHEKVPRSYEFVNEAPSIYNIEGRTNPARYGELGRYFTKETAAFVPLGELGGIVARLNQGSTDANEKLLDDQYNRTFHFCIWTARHSVLNPFEPESSRQSLRMLEARLTLAGDEFGVDVFENDLQPVLDRIAQPLADARAKYLAFSLPVIFLGLYLGLLGVDMGMAERRQEAALLKSRGATRRHLVRLFIMEGLILGVLAGILGLVAGALISAALFWSFLGAAGDMSPGLYITAFSAGLSMFLGVLLMVLAMFRPARRAARAEISEGLHYYSTEESTERYNPTYAVAGTSISIMFYLVIVLFDPQKWTEEGRPLDSTFLFLSVLRAAGLLLSWLIPLLLIFGMTGLLTRASYRPYAFLARMTRPFTGELWPVVDRNLVRNPKRASRVCIIIAISITFGILVTSWAATESDHQERLSRAVVGADVRAVFSSSGTPDAGIGPAIGALPHMGEVAVSYKIDQASIAWGGVDLYAIQARNYSRVAYLDGRLFLEGSPAEVASLAGGKRLIINEALQDQTPARAGDTVNLKITTGFGSQPIQLSCRIVAVVKALPGLMGEAEKGFIQTMGPAAYIDLGNLDLGSVPVTQVAAFARSPSPGEAASEIRAAFGGGRLVKVLSEPEYLSELQGGAVSISDYKFLLIESGFALVIVTAGLALILTAAVYERRKETAGWMARGATRRQVASIFVSEAMTLLALALAVGMLAGFMTAYMALGLFGTSAADPVGRSLVLSSDTLWLVAATVASLFITSYAVSWKASRVDLAQALRMRGG